MQDMNVIQNSEVANEAVSLVPVRRNFLPKRLENWQYNMGHPGTTTVQPSTTQET